MRPVCFCLLLGMLLGNLGCQPQRGSGSPSDAPAAGSPVALKIGSVDEYNALLEKHAGKVVLVDFWATWCGPCVEGFPHTVELANTYRDQGLATIAVSIDEPEEADTVRAFLTSQGATFDNLLSQDGGGQKTAELFDFEGAVPHYRLYNRAGELIYQWNGKPPELEEKIQELLKGA